MLFVSFDSKFFDTKIEVNPINKVNCQVRERSLCTDDLGLLRISFRNESCVEKTFESVSRKFILI